MTNTLTYSKAAVTTWTGATSTLADFGRIPLRSAGPERRNRSFFRQPAAQILENLNYLVRHTCQTLTDHAALVLVGGVVSGMLGMATALGISLTL
jgi:hypothetical protein